MLKASPQTLAERYRLLMLDLDGVVYRGPHGVPGVPGHLDAARGSGAELAFVTNNAARTPDQVAEHLRRLGVDCGPQDVVTSSMAAAGLLDGMLAPGSVALVLGAPALAQAVQDAGHRAVLVGEPGWREVAPAALVSGYGPDLAWQDIIRAAVWLRQGVPWVAANADLTFPADFGVAPGHGALVELLRQYSGVEPQVAGKPAPPLLREAMRRGRVTEPGTALMIGDRLDTDIAAGHRAGTDTLLVMTGVTDAATLLSAPRELRPDQVVEDLSGLMRPQPVPRVGANGWWHQGPWAGRIVAGALEVVLSDERDPDCWDAWWQVAATVCWDHLDATGRVAVLPERLPPSQR